MRDKLYETFIDSISLKTNTLTSDLNSAKLKGLIDLLKARGYFIETKKINDFQFMYKIYKASKTLLSIQSGINGNNRNNSITYYLELSFCGLQSYNIEKDEYSVDLLNYITNYWLNEGVTFELSELDICLDISNIETKQLFIMRKHIPSDRKINPLEPWFDYKNNSLTDTYYIEKQNNSMRSYIYNKTNKEYEIHNNILDENIVRFEVKIKKRFRLLKDNNLVKFISKQLALYQIYIFNTEAECNKFKRTYISNGLTESYLLKKGLVDKKRLYFDINMVEKFITETVLYIQH